MKMENKKHYRYILPKVDESQENTVTTKRRMYTCADCGESLSRYAALVQHEDTHRLEQEQLQAHICKKCCTLFENDIELNRHAVACSSFSCQRCHKTYTSRRFLLRHMQQVHNQHMLFHYCGICSIEKNKKSYVRSTLIEHYLECHQNLADEEFVMNEEFLDEMLLAEVSENSLVFTEWETLDLDMLLTEHPTDGFKCPECFVECINIDEFFKHMKTTHPCLYLQYKTNPQCPYCERNFNKISYLRQHLLRLHAAIKPHVCQICDKKFPTEDNLRKHVLSVHNNIRRYTCNVCNKRFLQNSHLKKHLLRHSTGNQYTCTLCNITCIRQIDLIRHVNKDHDIILN